MFSIWLLSLAIVLGVLVNRKGRLSGLPRFGISELHRNVSLLAAAFVVVHVLTVAVDSYVHTSVTAIFVPFISSYDRQWISLGAIAFDFFLAVIFTSMVRQRVGHRAWLAIHWFTYLAWGIALVHGAGIANDLRSGSAEAVTWVCTAAVAAAFAWRVATSLLATPRGRRTAAVFALIQPPPARPDPGGPDPAAHP